jgi:Flp pilus assembly pilin Flp
VAAQWRKWAKWGFSGGCCRGATRVPCGLGRQVAEKRQPFIVIKLKGLNLLNLGLRLDISPVPATCGRVGRMRVVKLKCLLTEFAADESGATAIEYGLIAAGIALAIIEIIYALGTNLVAKLQSLATALK